MNYFVLQLLQFLVGMMSSQSNRLAYKRRMPIMYPADTKPSKIGRMQQLSVNNVSFGRKMNFFSSFYDLICDPTFYRLCNSSFDFFSLLKMLQGSQNEIDIRGPVIHDVTELLESEQELINDDNASRLSDACNIDTSPMVDSPGVAENQSPESILGQLSPDNSNVFLSVDPSTINPTISAVGNQQQNLNSESFELLWLCGSAIFDVLIHRILFNCIRTRIYSTL